MSYDDTLDCIGCATVQTESLCPTAGIVNNVSIAENIHYNNNIQENVRQDIDCYNDWCR